MEGAGMERIGRGCGDRRCSPVFGTRGAAGRSGPGLRLFCAILGLFLVGLLAAAPTGSEAATKTAAPTAQPKVSGATVPTKAPAATFRAPKKGIWLRIVKSAHRLYAYDGRVKLGEYPVALGSKPGQKVKAGDRRTPEGAFSVALIQDARAWTHDFGDGKGAVAGAYGSWFIRLKTGWNGIGIHGTHDPTSIGKNVTEGCIRLRNEDLEKVKALVKVGTPVLIEP
jgi:lipoprotein-anchoring transpeptidase ErfK/SrfK